MGLEQFYGELNHLILEDLKLIRKAREEEEDKKSGNSKVRKQSARPRK